MIPAFAAAPHRRLPSASRCVDLHLLRRVFSLNPPRVERWVAQADVMPRAAAVVGHGGSGSTLIALAAGVPLALVPLFVDGPENARRVADAGAAIVVGDAADLAGAVRRLLDDDGYVRAARGIAEEIRALPPIDAAVDVFSRA